MCSYEAMSHHVEQGIDLRHAPLVGCWAGCWVGGRFGGLVGQLVGQLVGWLVGWLDELAA